MIGRVEEWMKPICQKHNCRYYEHHDCPYCSYCCSPDASCPVLYPEEKEQKEGDEK